MSADGRRYSLTSVYRGLGTRPGCSGGSSCLIGITRATHYAIDISDPANPQTLWSAVIEQSGAPCQISADGKSVYWYATSGTLMTASLDAVPYQPREAANFPTSRLQRLDDGRFFAFGSPNNEWGILAADGRFTPLMPAISPVLTLDNTQASGDGRRVFYLVRQSPAGDIYTLHMRDFPSGADVELYTGEALGLNPMVTDSTGSVVIFGQSIDKAVSWQYSERFYVQLYAWTSAGVVPLLEGEPVTAYTLSSDGKSAFCVTARGRILRLNLRGDSLLASEGVPPEAVELVPRTPRVYASDYRSTPGSQMVITGTGLADRAVAVPPGERWGNELDGIRVTKGGSPLAIGFVSPTELRVQLPFEPGELGDGFGIVSSDSPFQSGPMFGPEVESYYPKLLSASFFGPVSGDFYPYTPAIYRDGSRELLQRMKNGDWGPVKAGERLHLYMTGLGPVTPRVATGDPSPADPPAQVETLPICNDGEVKVERALLEPGLVGVYRMTIVLPDRLTRGVLWCGGSGIALSYQ